MREVEFSEEPLNLHGYFVAETWVLQDCWQFGITLRCLDSCGSHSVGFVVTDNCLPLWETTNMWCVQILQINWHTVTSYPATVLEQDWDYENRMRPCSKSSEALGDKLSISL